MAKKFIPRLTRSGIYNSKFWYDDRNPLYLGGYGLPNCTAYAWGRFWELTGKVPNLPAWDAGDWYDDEKTVENYQRGQEPRLGAIACYGGGSSGHVAVVEAIHDDGSITLSQSGYSRDYWDETEDPLFFWTSRVYKNDGYREWWAINSGEYLQGFIYLDTPQRSLAEVAAEVLDGEWGNGDDRARRLKNAGYNYNLIQDYVNKLLEKPTNKWIKDDKGWWYKLAKGGYPKNQWQKINGEWYFFDKKGYAYQSRWLLYKNKWYWFDETCKMVKDKFVKVGKETFYINKYGVCRLNYVANINKKLYAFNYRGALIKDAKINSDGEIVASK